MISNLEYYRVFFAVASFRHFTRAAEYLCVSQSAVSQIIKEMEHQSKLLNQSQIFIETPYRSDTLLADFVQHLQPSTWLCVAADLTLPTQYIRTRSIAQWRRDRTVIGRRPCVFIILA